MEASDSRQIKQVGSWDQIKSMLNENLLKKKNAGSECRTDSIFNGVDKYNITRILESE